MRKPIIVGNPERHERHKKFSMEESGFGQLDIHMQFENRKVKQIYRWDMEKPFTSMEQSTSNASVPTPSQFPLNLNCTQHDSSRNTLTDDCSVAFESARLHSRSGKAFEPKSTPTRNKIRIQAPIQVIRSIDEAFERMRNTQIFSLKELQFEKKSLHHFCSELKPEYAMKKLTLKSCCVNKFFLMTLLSSMPSGKVENLNLSRNKQLDLSLVKKLLTKLQCVSLNISNMEFDEDQAENLGDLNVRKLTLNYADFPATISKALAKLLKNNLEELSLVDSNITSEQFEDIAQNLCDCNDIHLIVLDLSHIKLEEKSLESIATIINKTTNTFEKFSLFNCGLNGKSLKAFTQKIKTKIRDLVIGRNKVLAKDGMQAVVDLARAVDVKRLDLSSLSLEVHHIQQLVESPVGVTDLDLTENPEIEATDVGNLVRVWKVRKLNISECQFLKNDFEALVKSMKSHKLTDLCIKKSRIQGTGRRDEVTSILEKVADRVS